MTPEELLEEEVAKQAEAAARPRPLLLPPVSDESPFTQPGGVISGGTTISPERGIELGRQSDERQRQRQAGEAAMKAMAGSPLGKGLAVAGEYGEKAAGNLMDFGGAAYDAARSIPPYALSKLEQAIGTAPPSESAYEPEKRLAGQLARPVWDILGKGEELWRQATSTNAPPKQLDITIPHDATNTGEQFRRAGENFGVAMDPSFSTGERLVSGLTGLARSAINMGNPFAGGKQLATEFMPGQKQLVQFASREAEPLGGLARARRGVLNLGPGPHKPEDLALKKVIDKADEIAGVKRHDDMDLPQNKRDDLDRMIGPIINEPGGVERFAAMTPQALEAALRDNLSAGRIADKAAGVPGRTEDLGGLTTGRTTIEDVAAATKKGTPRSPQNLSPEDVKIRVDKARELIDAHLGGPPSEALMIALHKVPGYRKGKGNPLGELLEKLGGKKSQNKADDLDEILNRLSERVAPNETKPTTAQGRAVAEAEDVAKQAEDEIKVLEPETHPVVSLWNQIGEQTTTEEIRDAVAALQGKTAAEIKDVAEQVGMRFSGSPSKASMIAQLEARLKTQRGDSIRSGSLAGSTPSYVKSQTSGGVATAPASAPPSAAPGGGAPSVPPSAQLPGQPPPTPPNAPSPLGPRMGPTTIGKNIKRGPAAPPPPPPARVPKPPVPMRQPEAIDIPETPEYAGGLFKSVLDRVKRWNKVPAMQEHAARARQVIGDVTSWASRELPGTGKSVLRNLVEAAEGMVDNRWWWNRARTPKESTRQVLTPVAAKNDPDLLFYNVTAAVDDYARSAVGAPNVVRMTDPAAVKFRDGIRVATSDTGQAFQDAGMFRHGKSGAEPFRHDPLIGRIPHHLIDQPWMHENNPEAIRFLDKVKKLPGNEKFDPADFWRELEAYRLDPERPAAAEFVRNLKTLPDEYIGADGTRWKINRAVNEFMPNSATRGSLPGWYEEQLKRAMVVKQYGQRGFLDKTGKPHPSVLDHMSDILKRVQQEVSSVTGDVAQGDQAARDAEQLFSVLAGQRKLGGYYDFRKLGRQGFLDKLADASRNTWAAMKLSGAAVKQAAQTLQETVARTPDLAGIPKAIGKLSYEYPRALMGETLRLVSSLGGETKAAEGVRSLAEAIAPSSTHELSDAGHFVDDLMTGGFKAFETMGSPMTARRPAAPAASMWERFTTPFRKLRGVDPNDFINAALSIPAMGFDGLFKMTTRMNNVVNKRMGDFYVSRYKELAKQGLDEAAAIRLRQQNVSEDLIKALQEGRSLTPDELERLGAQVPIQATRQSQIQPRAPEELHRMFNDKVGHAFQMFKSYVYANGRFLEDHANLIRSIKDNPHLTVGEKTKQITGELVRATARVAGMQAAGELERELARRAGRENSVLEETVPGRILANLLYASYFGPLYLIADTVSYHAGLQRPHAVRGGKEQKPFDLVDIPVIGAANEAIEVGSAAAGAPVRAVAPDVVRPKFNEERDSATARATRDVASIPGVKQALAETIGPDAAKALRTTPRRAAAAKPHPFLDGADNTKHPFLGGGKGQQKHPFLEGGKKGKKHPFLD